MTESFVLILSILLGNGAPQELRPPHSFQSLEACERALSEAKTHNNLLGSTCVRRDIYCKLRDCTHIDEEPV